MNALIDDLCDALRSLPNPMDPKFAPPATDEEVRAAETALGFTFPESFVEFLQFANGQMMESKYSVAGDYIIPSMRLSVDEEQPTAWGCLMPLDLITESTQFFRDDYEGEEPEGIRCFGAVKPHYDHIFITNCSDAFGICLDPDPPENGNIGQLVTVNGNPDFIGFVAPTFAKFIETITQGIRDGRFKQNETEMLTKDPRYMLFEEQ